MILVFYLSNQSSEEYHTIQDISEATDLTESYLRKIVKELSRTPYISTKKGPHGGVKIKKSSLREPISDLLRKLDEFNLEGLNKKSENKTFEMERAFTDWCHQHFEKDILNSITIGEATKLSEQLLKEKPRKIAEQGPEFRSLTELEFEDVTEREETPSEE